MELWIKRDDMSGNTLSGNKVRKLEFLIADAMAKECDSIITIGGIQSNHCRATAVAARYLGMDAHLILRNSTRGAESDPGLIGNLLVDRLVGSHIHQVSKGEYQQYGQKELCHRLERDLIDAGKRPYVIPVGGTNALGTWGYMECIHEILNQSKEFTDIIIACGSGATAGGLGLGNLLSGMGAKIHAYIVCDNPDYFYNTVDEIYKELGATILLNGLTAKDTFTAIQAKGAGYAISRPEELEKTLQISMETGVILDPVYSGKAVYRFLKDMEKEPEKWRGKKVLFIHTGGLLGLYDKCTELQPLAESVSRVGRLNLQQSD
eukprot:g5435.t1